MRFSQMGHISSRYLNSSALVLTLLGVLTFSGGIPGGMTGMGAAVGVSALILTYLSYQSWRDKTMGKQLSMREPPEQNKPQPG